MQIRLQRRFLAIHSNKGIDQLDQSNVRLSPDRVYSDFVKALKLKYFGAICFDGPDDVGVTDIAIDAGSCWFDYRAGQIR